MFRYDIQIQVIEGYPRNVERFIVRADTFQEATDKAQRQCGDDWEIYSINKIWD